MIRLFLYLLFLVGVAGVFFGVPNPLPVPSDLTARSPDLENGRRLFYAAGCLSCHLPSTESGIPQNVPAGGTPISSPLGALYPPNITPDQETGIGQWTDRQFIRAMTSGVSPEGYNYLPAFPYMSYRHMASKDLLDLKAYLFSMSPVRHEVESEESIFVFLARAMTNFWQWLAYRSDPVLNLSEKGDLWNRGAYLVQGPGHCAECHTPRNFMMIPKGGDNFLAGGAHPGGEGRVPSLRGLIERGRYDDLEDLESALANGKDWGYTRLSAGGMEAVQRNLSHLPEDDIRAIATFLLDLP